MNEFYTVDSNISRIVNGYLEALFNRDFEFDDEGCPYYSIMFKNMSLLDKSLLEVGLNHYPFLGYDIDRVGEDIIVSIYV